MTTRVPTKGVKATSIGWEKHARLSLRYNVRATKMWEAINKYHGKDFKDAIVWDFGCGYGDLALCALEAGAAVVYLCDRDPIMVQMSMQKCIKYQGRVFGYQIDINVTTMKWAASHADIGIMTSVLPYLDFPTKVLKQARRIPLFFLECQYKGDGPGPDWLEDDISMGNYLEDTCGFWEYAKVGETEVIDRGTKRSIWACGHEGRIF